MRIVVVSNDLYARRNHLAFGTLTAVCARFCAYLWEMRGRDVARMYDGERVMIERETELLTLAQVAARLHVRPRTVQAWVRLGRIPALRLSPKVVRFDWPAVLAELRKHAEQMNGVKRVN